MTARYVACSPAETRKRHWSWRQLNRAADGQITRSTGPFVRGAGKSDESPPAPARGDDDEEPARPLAPSAWQLTLRAAASAMTAARAPNDPLGDQSGKNTPDCHRARSRSS